MAAESADDTPLCTGELSLPSETSCPAQPASGSGRKRRLDALLAMTEDDIVTRLTSLAAEYSSDGIAITICGERIHFEHTEESGEM
nr:hypothetical protein [uncultured Acetatifactor sp.]